MKVPAKHRGDSEQRMIDVPLSLVHDQGGNRFALRREFPHTEP